MVAALLLCACGLVVGDLFLRAVARSPSLRTRPPAERYAVDLATAPAWQLRLVPGIGSARARAIVSRRARGDGRGLASAEDLVALPGIGPGTVRRLQADDLPVRVLLGGAPLRWARERRDADP